MLTKKQQSTLILWAQNYSPTHIARVHKVTVDTIKKRFYRLKKSHPMEFNNAESIRKVYQQSRLKLKNTQCFTELGMTMNGLKAFEEENL